MLTDLALTSPTSNQQTLSVSAVGMMAWLEYLAAKYIWPTFLKGWALQKKTAAKHSTFWIKENSINHDLPPYNHRQNRPIRQRQIPHLRTRGWTPRPTQNNILRQRLFLAENTPIIRTSFAPQEKQKQNKNRMTKKFRIWDKRNNRNKSFVGNIFDWTS